MSQGFCPRRRLFSMSAYVGLPPSRTSPYPEIPWSVSMRMRVEWNGAPRRRATRRSVILRLEGREAVLTLASGLTPVS